MTSDISRAFCFKASSASVTESNAGPSPDASFVIIEAVFFMAWSKVANVLTNSVVH
jgi:hypothetical protein